MRQAMWNPGRRMVVLAAAVLPLFATGCFAARSRATLSIHPVNSDKASYDEVELRRAATFAANEQSVLAVVKALPRGIFKKRRPIKSFRANASVVVAASTAKPVTGQLVLFGGTSVNWFDVTSLTLTPAEGGKHVLRIIASDGTRNVSLTVFGRPSGFDRVLAKLNSRCRDNQVTLPIPGAGDDDDDTTRSPDDEGTRRDAAQARFRAGSELVSARPASSD